MCADIRQPSRLSECFLSLTGFMSFVWSPSHHISGVAITLPLSVSTATSQSVSQLSPCVSCHGSAHECLFVSFSSPHTQALHHPVNGFVRWPFHSAGQEDRQFLYQSGCLCLCVCLCTCFGCKQQDAALEIKRQPVEYQMWDF